MEAIVLRRTKRISVTLTLLSVFLGSPACADPDHIDTTESKGIVAALGEKMIGDLLPSRPEAGYMLARGSAGMVIAAQNKLKEMPRDFNPEKDILSPLRTVEAVWPDYQSENGERITSGLWACRDAVILMRMRMEYMAHGDVQAAKELAAAQNRKSDGCIGALYVINDAGKK